MKSSRKDQALTFISERQVEYQIAWSIFGQIFPLITFETFAIVFCTKFNITGIPAAIIYVVVPPLAVIGLIVSGKIMIKTGYAHKSQKYSWDINEDWSKAIKTLERMDSYLDKQEKK